MHTLQLLIRGESDQSISALCHQIRGHIPTNPQLISLFARPKACRAKILHCAVCLCNNYCFTGKSHLLPPSLFNELCIFKNITPLWPHPNREFQVQTASLPWLRVKYHICLVGIRTIQVIMPAERLAMEKYRYVLKGTRGKWFVKQKWKIKLGDESWRVVQSSSHLFVRWSRPEQSGN